MRQLTITATNDLALMFSNDIQTIDGTLKKMFHLHADYYEPTHYTINIKIQNLPLTRSQERKAFRLVEEIWNMHINPWIHEFHIETGHEIWSEGRSSGYLLVDGASEILNGDEDPDEIRPQLMLLLKFKSQWDQLFKEIARWLDTMPEPLDEE
jgi:hypothetical protein